MNELSHALAGSGSAHAQHHAQQSQPAVRIVPDKTIPSYQLIEGEPTSPVVLSVPHGGWQYPASLVNTDNLDRCASLADTGTAELGLRLAGGRYPVLIARCCRAVCDLNRPPSALDPQLCEEADQPVPAAYRPYVAAGYGVIPRLSAQKQPLYNTTLTRACWQALLDNWHSPYHNKLKDLLQTSVAARDEVILVDLHSMPDSPQQTGRQRLLPRRARHLPDFVFGNLHGATLTQKKAEAIDEVMQQSGYSWCWNTPYAGGYITRHFGLSEDKDNPVQVLQIEVNRGLFSQPNGRLDHAGLTPVSQIVSQLMTTLTEL